MERQIIKIDEKLCTGCGLCVPDCPEGALQLIDGKARLVSDLFCDGLGACLGRCPEGAITVETRDAVPYDEKQVMEENIIPKGKNTIQAHLHHLKEHGAVSYLETALDCLRTSGLPDREKISEEFREKQNSKMPGSSGCPGSREMSFPDINDNPYSTGNPDGCGVSAPVVSQLTQWPVQLHLLNPAAEQFNGADFILAADCTAFAYGGFHRDFLKGKKLTIACPKLDQGLDTYTDKIRLLMDEAKINTLTVVIMEVPCCNGLLMLAKKAAEKSTRRVPAKKVVVSIRGQILSSDWI